jgi:hypothetical protein
MTITVISKMNPEQVSQAAAGFARRYADDWEAWLNTPASDRTARFGHILRKWQATRPYAMRRTRDEKRHDLPFLEDLIAQAKPHLDAISDLPVGDLWEIGPQQEEALRGLRSAVTSALLRKRPA